MEKDKSSRSGPGNVDSTVSPWNRLQAGTVVKHITVFWAMRFTDSMACKLLSTRSYKSSATPLTNDQANRLTPSGNTRFNELVTQAGNRTHNSDHLLTTVEWCRKPFRISRHWVTSAASDSPEQYAKRCPVSGITPWRYEIFNPGKSFVCRNRRLAVRTGGDVVLQGEEGVSKNRASVGERFIRPGRK